MVPIVAMQAVTKIFGGTVAVDAVDFDVRPGEVHALLGGNGAGKSTLIKVLAGVHAPEGGRILFAGRAVDPRTEALPIAFIHQDLALVEPMTVAENIALAAGFPRRHGLPWLGLIDWRAVSAQAERALALLGCPLDPLARVASLSRTDKSVVAIARALATEAQVLVLDEPTASLPEAEVGRLFAMLSRLRDRGGGMVYVSHRLDEIFRISDRVTVMRDGRRVATRATADTTPAELVELIVGRVPPRRAARVPAADVAPLLDARGVVVGEVGPLDFAVRPGEILGLAGLRGAGQEAAGRGLCGILPLADGTLALAGRPLALRHPADAVTAGIAFVSSKRQEESLALTLAVRENLFVNPAVERRGAFSALGRARERAAALTRLRAVGARPLASEPAINTFSGGNQQKVVLSRWLGGGMKVLVLEEPTMGVDVGAKADIYALLDRHAAAGGAVIVVSTDLEEIAAICGRALIFDRGCIAAKFSGAEITVAALITHVGGAAGAPEPVNA